MATRCTFSVIDTQHKRMRTKVVVGWFTDHPKPGHPFVVTAAPLSDCGGAGIRVIQTSVVVGVVGHHQPNHPTRYNIYTASGSQYELVETQDDETLKFTKISL